MCPAAEYSEWHFVKKKREREQKYYKRRREREKERERLMHRVAATRLRRAVLSRPIAISHTRCVRAPSSLSLFVKILLNVAQHARYTVQQKNQFSVFYIEKKKKFVYNIVLLLRVYIAINQKTNRWKGSAPPQRGVCECLLFRLTSHALWVAR